MINIHFSAKGTPYVWANELHIEMEIQEPLVSWFTNIINYGFKENIDYSCHHKHILLDDGVNTYIEYKWAIKLEVAKTITIIQNSNRGRIVRENLISLENKVQEGKLLNHEQILALMDLCKVLGYFTVQKYVEKEHFDVFQLVNQPLGWWTYRARLFGTSAKELKEMLAGLGVTYKNQRSALMKIDKYELVRIATVDLFIAMGKSENYALNVGQLSKQFAKELKIIITNDEGDAIDFKSDEEKDIIKQLHSHKNQPALLNKF